MAKGLERDLGLFSVIAISVGAMVGSGIFILPALAVNVTGPSVVLAYLVAGLLVLPAALSKAEMATAMPEAGGTYLYIDRAMGPLMGTIAGLGTWFSLSFKGALALIGGAPYIVLLFDVPVKALALVIGLALIIINIVGVKQTGGLQTVIVTAMVLALLGFIYSGITWVDSARYHPFLEGGTTGLLAAAGMVYVSYAGVTKIASVAEEIEDPGRIVPLGMLGSLAFTTLLYVLIVYVMVGVVDTAALADTDTPMAAAASSFLGEFGVVVIAVAAILALVSTANAGILSSSRYPLAMARDALMPEKLADVSDRFRTPIPAISVTGLLVLAMVAFVPILQIAKLASAFKILVFILINIAVVGFREASVTYEPEFESPLYPWMQIFGVGGGIVLLTQMGTIPLLGAVVITAGGLAWYHFYVAGRAEREGAAMDVLRRTDKRNFLADTEELMEDIEGYRILIPVQQGTPETVERKLLEHAADIVRQEGGEIRLIRFDVVPDQMDLELASENQTPAEVAFEQRHATASEEWGVTTHVGEIVSHDLERAIANYAGRANVDLVIAEDGPRHRFFHRGMPQMLTDLDHDVVLLRPGTLEGAIERVDVVSDQRPFDPLKVRIANAIASNAGASIRFLHGVPEDAAEAQIQSIRDYHNDLAELCTVPVSSRVVRGEDRAGSLLEAVEGSDVVVTLAREDEGFLDRPLERLRSRMDDHTEATVLSIVPEDRRKRTILTKIVERLAYRTDEAEASGTEPS